MEEKTFLTFDYRTLHDKCLLQLILLKYVCGIPQTGIVYVIYFLISFCITDLKFNLKFYFSRRFKRKDTNMEDRKDIKIELDLVILGLLFKSLFEDFL